MANLFERRLVWNRSHEEKPSSNLPDEEVILFAEHIQHLLHQKAWLLDAGCGRGRNALYLSKLNFDIIGCDISYVALKKLKSQFQNKETSASLQTANLTHLPYIDSLFTAAICIHVLPYHRKHKIAQCISELKRVLQPKGWLYFDLLDCDDSEYGCGQMLEKNTFLDTDNIPVHFSTRQEIDEIMDGFSLNRVTRFKHHSRIGWRIWAIKS